MKFCLFYAWREMRRRPLRFISLGCFLGVFGFVMTAFCLLLTVYSGKPTEALRQFGVLYFVFGILLTVVMGYLCLERYRSAAVEYVSMRQMGLTDTQLQKIHLLQMLLLSVMVLPAAQTASVFGVRGMVLHNASAFSDLRQEIESAWPGWYVSRLSFPSLSCSFPMMGKILIGCFAAMLVMGLAASFLAHVRYCRRDLGTPLQKLGERAAHTVTDMKIYCRETNVRMHAFLRHLRTAAAAAMLLPIFFLGAALLFTNASTVADMVITTRDTTHSAIDPVWIAQVSSICGAEQVRMLTDGDIVWALQIDLPDSSWIAAAAEILHPEGCSSYDVSVSHLSVTFSNLKSQQLRQGFILMAAASFFAACIAIVLIVFDLFRARQSEFRILHMYGIRNLLRIKASAAFRLLIPCCLSASVVGVALVIGLHLGGGASVGLWGVELLLCGIGLGVVLPIIFAGVTSWLFRMEESAEDL